MTIGEPTRDAAPGAPPAPAATGAPSREPAIGAPSHGLWHATAPPAPACAPLHEDTTADVAVIGAGYTGLSAALHLAQRGARVVVLEAAEIGFGASGRNVGLVNAGLWLMPHDVIARLGETHGAPLVRLLGDAPAAVFDLVRRHGIACDATHAGTLHCAVGRAGAREIAERERQWRALGAPVRRLDADETARRTGTDAYAGALFDARAGTVQPLAYARGLARAAIDAGARLHVRSAVRAVDDEGGAWRLHCASRASVCARHVIVATDAYTEAHGAWAALRAELVRLPYFNLATPPLPEPLRRAILPGGEGAWDTHRVLSSFRLDAHGRMIYGSVGSLGGARACVHRDWGRRALARLFPALAHMAFEHAWHGDIGMTIDALPRLHRLARDTWSVGGYNGRGIAPGTVLGRELARLVASEAGDVALPLPVTPIVPVAWRGAREALYEIGSRLAHLVQARGVRSRHARDASVSRPDSTP